MNLGCNYLDNYRSEELRPARHLTQFLALVVLIGEGLKFMSRDKP